MTKTRLIEPSSFRDPSGFVFFQDGEIYRQINKEYKENYLSLKQTGLYDRLVKRGFLVAHKEIEKNIPREAALIIKPRNIPFISYPYEWCFSQLKEAALLTLNIQLAALKFDMSLKDASAYNVQFEGASPVFIDTLSFEKYPQNKPWVAYRQFCQHFLAPLSLMSKTDLRSSRLLQLYLDGIPLDLCAKLLPTTTKFNPGLLAHLHLHAKSQQHFSTKETSFAGGLKKEMLISLLSSLKNTVESLSLKKIQTQWGDYYDHTNYSEKSFDQKKRVVDRFLLKTKSKTVLDLGANTGVFSQIAARRGAYTIAADIDPLAVERNFLTYKEENMLPLVLDITNPSPALGWGNQERSAFLSRLNTVDATLALALVHHLAIGNNTPLGSIAALFAQFSPYLIVEFVPKEDSQTKRLLAQRQDVFPNYNQSEFEKMFGRYFKILEKEQVDGSYRTIYLMKRK